MTTAATTMEEVLARLGVSATTLADAERSSLDKQGYVILQGVVADDELARLRAAFEQADRQGDALQGNRSYETHGTRHANLAALPAPTFERAWAHPRVLAAAFHVIRLPFRLGAIGGRDPLPGLGAQALHSDWGGPAAAAGYEAVTTIAMLDDFTRENGATRLVPGSHRWSAMVPKELANPERHHPAEMRAIAPAGSVLVFNARLWHSGMRNESRVSRRGIQCSYVPRVLTGILQLELAGVDALAEPARFLVGT